MFETSQLPFETIRNKEEQAGPKYRVGDILVDRGGFIYRVTGFDDEVRLYLLTKLRTGRCTDITDAPIDLRYFNEAISATMHEDECMTDEHFMLLESVDGRIHYN